MRDIPSLVRFNSTIIPEKPGSPLTPSPCGPTVSQSEEILALSCNAVFLSNPDAQKGVADSTRVCTMFVSVTTDGIIGSRMMTGALPHCLCS